MIGIPLMLTVLANVGSLMAEGLEYSWTTNKERLSRLAGLLRSGARTRRKLNQERTRLFLKLKSTCPSE